MPAETVETYTFQPHGRSVFSPSPNSKSKVKPFIPPSLFPKQLPKQINKK